MFSRRYLAMWCAILLLAACAALAATGHIAWLWIIVPVLLVALGAYDLSQKRHAILRNYPLWGHFRFMFEFIRPEIRQYFVEDDTEEKPFSRAQRSIVYQRAKNETDSRPYGTEIDVKAVAHEWISHSLAPTKLDGHDFRIVVGAERAQPYSMSIFNVSAMSFGSLPAKARCRSTTANMAATSSGRSPRATSAAAMTTAPSTRKNSRSRRRSRR